MKFLILSIISVLFLFSCSEETSNKPDYRKESLAVTIDLNKYAKGFEIKRVKDLLSNYIEIKIKDKDDTSKVLQTLVLYKEKKPNFKGVNDIQVIKVPVGKTIALASTHIGMMNDLGVSDKIVGVSGKAYLCQEELKGFDIDKVEEVQDIGQAYFETYLAVNPEMIIYSGFNNSAPLLTKLRSAGLNVLAHYGWKEHHPLGKAEWIKVLGLLYDKEAEANEIFNAEVKKYNALVALAKTSKTNPKLLSGHVYGDFWNAPAGESFVAQFYKDANINYVYKDTKGTGSLSLSFEEVLTQNKEVSNWIDVRAEDLKTLKDQNEKYTLFDAYKAGHVYSNMANGNCFWQESAAHPSKTLKDLILLFHPELGVGGDLNFYQQLK